MKAVTIYTTPTCGFCKAAKEFLKKHDVSYIEHNVTDDEAARKEMITLSGQLGVPFIIIGEGDDKVMITGFDEQKISEALGV